jgi:hypothetical protein
MNSHFSQKPAKTKSPGRFWWLKWCLDIYTESLIERFRNTNGPDS